MDLHNTLTNFRIDQYCFTTRMKSHELCQVEYFRINYNPLSNSSRISTGKSVPPLALKMAQFRMLA